MGNKHSQRQRKDAIRRDSPSKRDQTLTGQTIITFAANNPEGWLCYHGMIREGRFHGRGYLRWVNGTQYWGNFVEGRMEGQGRLVLKEGGKAYIANWKDGCLEGSGFLRFSTEAHPIGAQPQGSPRGDLPQCFIGCWKEGKLEGYGEMRFRDGSRCFGVWREGKRQIYQKEGGDRVFVSTGEMHMAQYEQTGLDPEFGSIVIMKMWDYL